MTGWTLYDDTHDHTEIFKQPFGTYAPAGWRKSLIGIARHSFLHRGTFRRSIFRIIQGSEANPVDTIFRDCHFRLQGGNNLIEYGILLHPDYNKHDIDFLMEDAEPGDNFVDIGANIGLYSLPLARFTGPQGKVIAIDANRLVCEKLAFNAAASSLDNIAIIAEGVSDHETHASLRQRNEDVAIVAIEENETGTIPVQKLSTILDEAGIDTIHGLKIDIEGHEDKALVPYFESQPRSRWPRRIVIETAGDGDDYPGCKSVFRKCGYELVGRTRQNSLYRLA